MTNPVLPNMRRVNHLWARAMVNMAWTQWTFLSAGLRFANRLMELTCADAAGAGSGLTLPIKAPAQPTSGGVENLVRLAGERMAKGLAPPPEIYQTPYRNQLDWSRFPGWARPTDPDVFEGCCHEG
jgi:hypothetical protein